MDKDLMIDEENNETVVSVEEKITPEAKPEIKEKVENTPVLPEGEIDLFAELSKPTDKDLDKKENKAPEGEKAAPVSEPKSELQNHQLTAKLTIAAISVGMGLLLQFISDDWTEDAEKRYALSPSRKGELLEPLEIMLANSKKKYNPVVVLVVTVLITYVPMIINAFRKKQSNLMEKRKKAYGIATDAKEVTEEAEAAVKAASEETVKAEPVTGKDLVSMNAITKRIKEIKAKKGRRSKADEEFMNSLGL